MSREKTSSKTRDEGCGRRGELEEKAKEEDFSDRLPRKEEEEDGGETAEEHEEEGRVEEQLEGR